MFSVVGTYPPVGLFSLTHIIVIIMCFVFVVVAVLLTKKMSEDSFIKMLRVFSIVLTLCELFKISWCISVGERQLDAWVPLYFCSFFIYALWCMWFKNDKIKNLGLSYITLSGFIAGAVFIILPTSSFSSFPIFHFQCLYSIFYHTLMMYSGLLALKIKMVKINWKSFGYFSGFVSLFIALAIILNVNTGSNLMFLANPRNIPIPLLTIIYNASHFAYTAVMVIAHLSIGLIVLIISNLYKWILNRKS